MEVDVVSPLVQILVAPTPFALFIFRFADTVRTLARDAGETSTER